MNQQPIQIEINVRISQPPYSSSGAIQLQQTFEIGPTTFMGLAAIMSKFHDLAKEIQQQGAYPPNVDRR